jgi:hypothetical protein
MRISAGGKPGLGEGADRVAAHRLCQGQPQHGCGSYTPGCVASTLHLRGGRGVPTVEKHPRRHRHAAGGEFPTASSRGLYSTTRQPQKQGDRRSPKEL